MPQGKAVSGMEGVLLACTADVRGLAAACLAVEC